MKLKIRPTEFANMDLREKAFIIAFIDHYINQKENFNVSLGEDKD